MGRIPYNCFMTWSAYLDTTWKKTPFKRENVSTYIICGTFNLFQTSSINGRCFYCWNHWSNAPVRSSGTYIFAEQLPPFERPYNQAYKYIYIYIYAQQISIRLNINTSKLISIVYNKTEQSICCVLNPFSWYCSVWIVRWKMDKKDWIDEFADSFFQLKLRSHLKKSSPVCHLCYMNSLLVFIH